MKATSLLQALNVSFLNQEPSQIRWPRGSWHVPAGPSCPLVTPSAARTHALSCHGAYSGLKKRMQLMMLPGAQIAVNVITNDSSSHLSGVTLG